MKIYTKSGDSGTTSLFGGERVLKDHLRIESYGTIDELNSYIGLIYVQDICNSHKDILIEIQKKLFIIGAILATPKHKEHLKNGKNRLKIFISEENITFLESMIDTMELSLPTMTHFILPGGNSIVAQCHIARCVCRRAERLLVHLGQNEDVDVLILKYINRLSDFLFVLARKISLEQNAEEIPWIPNL
jgi:cob(I)alamin adenosyltransferase